MTDTESTKGYYTPEWVTLTFMILELILIFIVVWAIKFIITYLVYTGLTLLFNIHPFNDPNLPCLGLSFGATLYRFYRIVKNPDRTS